MLIRRRSACLPPTPETRSSRRSGRSSAEQAPRSSAGRRRSTPSQVHEEAPAWTPRTRSCLSGRYAWKRLSARFARNSPPGDDARNRLPGAYARKRLPAAYARYRLPAAYARNSLSGHDPRKHHLLSTREEEAPGADPSDARLLFQLLQVSTLQSKCFFVACQHLRSTTSPISSYQTQG